MPYAMYLLIFVITANGVFAQTNPRYEQRLQESTIEIYNDIDKGEKTALSILNSTSDKEIRIYSLIVLSEAEQLRGNFVASLNYLYNAENLSTLSNDDCLKGISSIALVRFYYVIGLSKLASTKLDSFIEDNSCKNSDNYNFRLEFEQALSFTGKKRVNNLKELKEKLNPDDFLSDNFRQKIRLELADTYRDLGLNDSAEFYYKQLNSEEVHPVFIAKARLGLAQLNIHSFQNLIEADSLLQTHFDVETQRAVSKLLCDYYYQNDNNKLYKQEILKFTELEASISQNKKEARDLVIAHLESVKIKNRSFASIQYIILFSALILLSTGGIFYYYKTKRDYEKFLKLMAEKRKFTEPKTQTIPEQTEQLLLQKLEKFERFGKFIQPGISLTSLAKSLDTNTKYLSDVINRNKEVNFNQYINELRINYIINKMKEEPKYLNYKMYYLAKECGFSSQSTFSSVFKSVTGISPLSFIKFLKNERKG